MKNTITFKQIDLAIKAFETRQDCDNEPVWHSSRILDETGEEWNECDDSEAVKWEVEVVDYDGEHDYDILTSVLREVGVELDWFTVEAYNGDSEDGRIFGFILAIKH